MSGFSMMTKYIPWPVSYGIFTIGMFLVAWITYVIQKHFETRPSRGKSS